MNPTPLRLAMLGMVDGNGHPWSWSALLNGWETELMAACPYAGIPLYLEANREREPIAGANVTHIWTDAGYDAQQIAAATYIPHVLEDPLDAIGQVDAVVIATDKGNEHVERARPFVEAGIPVFVDKPLCDNEDDLRTFVRWEREGRPILSSSGLRYSREFAALRGAPIGKLRYGSVTSPKSWERYGIHALEGIYPLVGPGFISAQNTGSVQRNVVHLKHGCGADIVVAVHQDMLGGMGVLQLVGTSGHVQTAFADTYFAFRSQLEALVLWLQTGVPPFAWSQTVELMKLVIAGIRSREQGGREVLLSEIDVERQ